MPNKPNDHPQQIVITPHIPTDVQQILDRIEVTLPISGRHLYTTGHGAEWLSPYNAALLEDFRTHHNNLITDSRICIQYLTKYVSGEEERAVANPVAKSESHTQFNLIDEGTRKRTKLNTNAQSQTYNTRSIADTEICDNLLGKNYRETGVTAHSINIGPPEFRLHWTNESSFTKVAAPSAQRSAVYGAINSILVKWQTLCDSDRYAACSPTPDQFDVYNLLICRPQSDETNTYSQWEVLCGTQPAIVTPQYWPPPTQPTRFLVTFLNNFIIHTATETMTEQGFYSNNTLVAICKKYLQGRAVFAINLYCTKVLLLQPIGQRQFNLLLQEVHIINFVCFNLIIFVTQYYLPMAGYGVVRLFV